LFTQLAIDAYQYGGTKSLSEASAETFWPVLRKYFKSKNIDQVADRIAVAEHYYSYVGLGQIEFGFGNDSGYAALKHSHVDEGWLKKWGQTDKPVNYIGEGYIRAAWAAIYGKDPEIPRIEEVQSIARGASTSRFDINW
jgi:predicted hydrocarbon binding protein